MLTGFSRRIKRNVQFHTKSFLCLSFVWNIAYAAFLFAISQIYQSKWFLVTAAYFCLLSVARLFCFSQINEKHTKKRQMKTMRACGIFLLLMNVAVALMSFLLLDGERNISHHKITVITIAAYTFTTLTVAIVNSVRYAKKKEYGYFTAKIIHLVAASVSMITLTDTMLSTFGEDSAQLKLAILPALCVAVFVFIIAASGVIIYQAKEIER